MKTPNFVLTEEHNCATSGDSRMLPAGAFIRPIELIYLPRHITEADRHRYYSPQSDIYAYTRYGIICIPKYKVRQT